MQYFATTVNDFLKFRIYFLKLSKIGGSSAKSA